MYAFKLFLNRNTNFVLRTTTINHFIHLNCFNKQTLRSTLCWTLSSFCRSSSERSSASLTTTSNTTVTPASLSWPGCSAESTISRPSWRTSPAPSGRMRTTMRFVKSDKLYEFFFKALRILNSWISANSELENFSLHVIIPFIKN